MIKRMNHAEYQRTCKHRSVQGLQFVIEDADAAIRANPNGENAGYYADEIHYCLNELRARGCYRSNVLSCLETVTAE